MWLSRSFAWLLLPAALELNGCSIVERSQQCSKVAKLFDKSRPALAPALPENPQPEALHHKAKLYKELAKQLKALKLKAKEIKEPTRTLADQLTALSKRLAQAGKAAADVQKLTKAVKEADKKFKRDQDDFKKTKEQEKDNKEKTGKSSSARSKKQSLHNDAPRLRAQKTKATRKYMKKRSEIEEINRKVQGALGQLRGECS